jgi:hypothetical protein
MINKSWQQLAPEDISRLVSDVVPESHTLDYKEAAEPNAGNSSILA